MEESRPKPEERTKQKQKQKQRPKPEERTKLEAEAKTEAGRKNKAEVEAEIDAGRKFVVLQTLLAAARYAYDHAYNTPYMNPDPHQLDDHALKHADGSILHRCNHSLAHAIRQTWYWSFMLHFLRSSKHMNQDEWKRIGHRELLSCQLRLIFEATGRETDFGWPKEFTVTSLQHRQSFISQVQPDASEFHPLNDACVSDASCPTCGFRETTSEWSAGSVSDK